MKINYILIALLFALSSCNKTEDKQGDRDYTQYVNGFIGNADNGHTFPGATYPFGLIQASPESGYGSWRYCSGYNYDDDFIEGFAQTHLNGTGVPDLGDILLLPFTGSPKEYKSKYNKTTHQSTAGYYGVTLTDFDIDVELTATEHTAFHKYTYKKEGENLLLVDLQRGLVDPKEYVNERVLKADIKLEDEYTITGSQEVEAWVKRQYHYIIKFNKPYIVKEELARTKQEKAKRYILAFNPADDEPLMVKVAISSVSVAGALTSLEKENPTWDFDITRNSTKARWNELLSRVEVEGSEDEKTNFYTSMYHLFIQPNNVADTNGQYRGADDKVASAKSGKYYSTFSLWDTYRAAHPLYTLLTPELVDGVVESMIAHQKTYGYLPIWTLWGKENYCMIGNHAVPVIVDAYLKGYKGFDHKEAYQAIKESLTVSHKNSDWQIYDQYGYYPFDLINVESVSRTLESSYDDYCAAQMAKSLGKIDDYNFFIKRAANYKNLFDPETKLMRPKDANGKWKSPFDRFALSHAETHGGDYTEGNAWQYTWHVQHEPEELIKLFGGNENFVTKLDSLFFLDAQVAQDGFISDVTGLIGQYAHGNEPSHHVVYLYNFANRPDKTQELVREIFDRFYLPRPDGLCGNDDCGQMSAWYIFSAMGFYPVNPAGGEYIIGAPQIPSIKLSLPDGKTFKVEAKNISKENKYVEKVEWNGVEITDFRIHHKQVMNGGNLIFTMTNEPKENKK